jgi:hypothetical protein
MSTRSFVSILVNDVYRTIYVHFDGYPEGVGLALQNFNTYHSALDLIAAGDRSSIDGEVYNEPYTEYSSFEEFLHAAKNSWIEWYYIFKNGNWHCGNTYSHDELYEQVVLFSNVISSGDYCD